MSFNSALTSGNYDSLRGTTSASPSHRARLSLSLCPNTNIYTARVNQVTFGASFAQIAYDGGSGTLADVRIGMTVLISHTNNRAAAFFVGRVRNTPTTSLLFVNETSAPVADNDYIFILDDFRIWDKLARYISGTLKTDYDNTFRQLLPRIYGLRAGYAGPAVSSALSFSFAPTVAAATDGASISTYLWEVADGTITVGNSATKDITASFPPGFRWIHFTVTDNGGRASTRHIPVWVHDDTYPVTLLDHGDLSITATLEDGYSGSVSAFDAIDTVLDNTLVCAWLDNERYNDTQTNIVNNVVLVGRLRTEANQTKYDDGQQDTETRFEIEGPLQQLARLEITSLQLDNNASPTRFNQIKTMTLWREIFLILTEYSTFHELHSLNFSDTTTSFQEKGIVTQQGNLLAVVNALANGIGAAIQMNAAGEAEVVRNAVLIPTADRSSLITVAGWDTRDVLGLSEGRSHVRTVGRLDASGGSYNTTSGIVTPALSLAPGVAQDYPEGSSQLNNQILAINQALAAAESELNIRSGHALAKAQGADELTIAHPDGYWWLTPSSNQWYTFTLDGSETARGIVLTTDIRWQLISVTVTHEIETGTRSVEAVYRKETSGAPGQAYRLPAQTSAPLALPKFPPLPAFPMFDIGPSFFLPDSPLASQVPGTLSGGTMWATPKHDGNTAMIWTADGAWLANDFIIKSTPTWKEITPPTLGGGIIQCRFIPTSPPGALIAAYAAGGDPWTHTFNFSEDEGGWVPNTGPSGNYSVYGSGSWNTVEFLDGPPCGGGQKAWVNEIVRNFSLCGLTSIRIVGSADAVAGGGDRFIYLNGIQSYALPTGAGAFDVTWSGSFSNATQILVTLDINCIAGTPASHIYQIVVSGTGPNPFAGTTVFYTSNVMSPTVTWTEGNAIELQAELMRIGSDFTNLYLWDATAGNAYFSTDRGATFGAPIAVGTPPASAAGFDTQKIGNVSLAGMDGKVRRATTQGGAYSDYGSALPASSRPTALLIPRYTFAGGNNGSGISNVDYLMASDTLSGAGDALWKVTATGATFTAIGPTDSGNKGLAVGPNCLAMPWVSAGYQDIVAILSFAGTRKLARTYTLGVSWALSATLSSSAAFITTRRSDTLHKQAFLANGANLGYVSDYQASPPVVATRVGPNAGVVLGIDILP